jgi:DNA-binding NarL/FixJ family response regulator
MLPLEPADKAELLAILSKDSDTRIAERAGSALLALPQDAFVQALARSDAAPQLFEYCREKLIDAPEIARALIGNLGCPIHSLIDAVIRLPAEEVKALADDMGLLSVRPELGTVLLSSTALGPDQRQMLEELEQGTPNVEVLVAAVKDAEEDPEKRQSLLQRLAHMRVTERMQLAFKGNREERMALIRDSARLVQRAVMQSPKLTEREVEGFASITSLSEEVLRLIATSRSFRKNYIIARNLCLNPKTPLDISLHLLPRINIPDLRTMTTNKNIPDTLRSNALKFFRQRTEER